MAPERPPKPKLPQAPVLPLPGRVSEAWFPAHRKLSAFQGFCRKASELLRDFFCGIVAVVDKGPEGSVMISNASPPGPSPIIRLLQYAWVSCLKGLLASLLLVGSPARHGSSVTMSFALVSVVVQEG